MRFRNRDPLCWWGQVSDLTGDFRQYTGMAADSESRKSAENPSCRPVFHKSSTIAVAQSRPYTAVVKPSALIVTVLPVVLIVWIGITLAHPPWTALRITGAAIAIFGFAMLSVARIQLGNAFSITPQANMLVTRGLYSRIRNPVYVFGAIALAGLFLYIQRPWLLLLLAVLIPMQVARARAESRVLEARFGDEYRRWREQTWF